MTELELLQTLYTQDWHTCPDGTTQYGLLPPHRATDGMVKLWVGAVEYEEQADWLIEELYCAIRFCPWCGQKLPTEKESQG